MKIIDENGLPVENPDLELGWLKDETEIVHHDAVDAVIEQSHMETLMRPDGTPDIYYDSEGNETGRSVRKVIDVPGSPAKPAWDEEVSYQRYTPYTEAELAERKAQQERAEKQQAILDNLPDLIESIQSAQSDTDSLMVDLTYRQTMMELGLEPEE